MLEKKTYKLLLYFYKKKKLTVEELEIFTNRLIKDGTAPEKVQKLLSDEFIKHLWDMDSSRDVVLVGVGIADRGSAFVEEKRRISRKAKAEWLRYGITTAIAIAALVKSFFFT